MSFDTVAVTCAKRARQPYDNWSSSSKSSSSAGAQSTDAAKDGEKKIKTIRSAITYDVEQLGYKKFPRKELKRMQDR